MGEGLRALNGPDQAHLGPHHRDMVLTAGSGCTKPRTEHRELSLQLYMDQRPQPGQDVAPGPWAGVEEAAGEAGWGD